MGISEIAKSQIRGVVLDEIRTELNRIVNPTFVETVTRGSDTLEKLFDHVLIISEQYDELQASLRLLSRVVEDLQKRIATV